MTLLPSNIVLFRYDVLHILNEINNDPLFTEIGNVVSPQGLVALILSAPDTPIGINYVGQVLETYDPGTMDKLSDPAGFMQFCASVSDEIDRATTTAFLSNPLSKLVATPAYFFGWNELSILTVIGSKDTNDNPTLRQLSAEKASQFRYYDGSHAFIRRSWFDTGPI